MKEFNSDNFFDLLKKNLKEKEIEYEIGLDYKELLGIYKHTFKMFYSLMKRFLREYNFTEERAAIYFHKFGVIHTRKRDNKKVRNRLNREQT